jgi:hypothetical protein
MANQQIATDVSQEVLKRVDTVGQKIDSIFTTLATKLGVATDYFWPLFVKQQVVSGAIQLTAGLLLCGLWALAAYKLSKWAAKKPDDLDTHGALFVAILALTVFAGIIFVVFVTPGLQQIFVPEVYALQQVIEMVKE